MNATHWTTRETEVRVPARRPDMTVETIEREAMLTAAVSGNTYHLNESALAVWNLCDGRRTICQLAERLTTLYDVEFDVAVDHIEQLVTLFAESQLTCVVGGV